MAKKSKILKIIVPILMILIAGGIWIVQNSSSNSITQSNNIPEDYALNTTSINLENLKKHELPIIIDFGADSCVPCKEMPPVLISLNKEMQEEAIIKFVDVWKNPSSADGYPIQVIPTQIICNADGSPYIPSEKVSSTIQFQMFEYTDSGELAFTAHQGGLTEDEMRLILADMGVE